jgi:putative transposase
VKFAFIDAEKAHHSVSALCRVLGVSRSGYYAWRERPPSTRQQQDEVLAEAARRAHVRSRGTYGSPRIHADLRADGHRVGRKRVVRVMRLAGIAAQRRRRYRVTTDSTHGEPVAANLVNRTFDIDHPNQVWASDITYVWTQQGWLYLAVIIDLFSRRVVGYSMGDDLGTQLPLGALAMALGTRATSSVLVHHSDRGCQYASGLYRQVLVDNGITCSMSRPGNCWDNAVVESFFSTIKAELIERRPWPTRGDARLAIHEYISAFYNRRRRHSYLGYLTPDQYEQNYEREYRAA